MKRGWTGDRRKMAEEDVCCGPAGMVTGGGGAGSSEARGSSPRLGRPLGPLGRKWKNKREGGTRMGRRR